MADISTRLATHGDLEALRGLYRRSSLSNEGNRANLLASPETLHWTGDHLAAGQTRVATDRLGRILGFATVVGIEGGRELEDLFVDPDAMRQGVATRLVLDAVAEAARDGVPWIEVTANSHAAEFYASAGFVWVRDENTLFGPAPRLRREVTASD
jgi:GNAT superfamily N-acetyltransferase